MFHKRIVYALAFVSLAVPALAADGVAASLQPSIDNRTLAGAVTLVASGDKVLSLETIGYSDIAAKR
jgi:hypothetical protein